MTPFEEWQAALQAANGGEPSPPRPELDAWEAALRVANERRAAELKAGGEFVPKPRTVPEYDPCDETTDSGRLMRSWLVSGRGSCVLPLSSPVRWRPAGVGVHEYGDPVG